MTNKILPLVSSSSSTPALLFDHTTTTAISTTADNNDTTTTTTTTTTSNTTDHVIVHPLVLLHVLDHHSRRQEASGRVIGTLLGRKDGTKVEVTNCFAVPHAERGDEVAIGKDFNKQMLSLYLRTNRKEAIVGWYASAPTAGGATKPKKAGDNKEKTNTNNEASSSSLIADTSSLIHEFYAGEIVRSGATPVSIAGGSTTTSATVAGGDAVAAGAEGGGIVVTSGGGFGGGMGSSAGNNNDPIHLVVDTRLKHDAISVRAYRSTPVIVQGEQLANLFHEISLSIVSNEPETICLHHMIKEQNMNLMLLQEQQQQEQTQLVKSSSSQQQQLSLQISMEKLYGLLESTLEYVDDVIEQQEGGSKKAATKKEDPEIGRIIADTLACIPRVRPEVFDQLFHDSLQDLLMVTYLSQITQTQITIAEKLNATLGMH